jgi:hypothetical protein
MIWGLDSAYLADDATVSRYYDLGWRWHGGYVGGAALHVWAISDWQRLMRAGLAALPIWVAPLEPAAHSSGINEGNACLDKLQELSLSGVVVLDVESNAVPFAYAEGFVDAVHAGKCSVVLYGAPDTLQGLSGLPFDAWWLASWVVPASLVKQAPPDWTLWQYATGPQCDFSVALDSFTFADFAAK